MERLSKDRGSQEQARLAEDRRWARHQQAEKTQHLSLHPDHAACKDQDSPQRPLCFLRILLLLTLSLTPFPMGMPLRSSCPRSTFALSCSLRKCL